VIETGVDDDGSGVGTAADEGSVGDSDGELGGGDGDGEGDGEGVSEEGGSEGATEDSVGLALGSGREETKREDILAVPFVDMAKGQRTRC
jgi:hypothetical protein